MRLPCPHACLATDLRLTYKIYKLWGREGTWDKIKYANRTRRTYSPEGHLYRHPLRFQLLFMF